MKDLASPDARHRQARPAGWRPEIGSPTAPRAPELSADEVLDLVGHEARGALANISAGIELLLASEPTDAVRPKLEIVGQEAARLTRLVHGLLDVGRMQAGRLALRRATADVGCLCRAAVDRAAATYPERSWPLDVAPGTPAVLADSERIGHVLDNLLDNAARYTPPGSPVSVAACPTPDGGEVHFKVADRGAGIPVDEVDRIFHRHYRGTEPATEPTAGHGLGLYLARIMVERHEGRIWVDRSPEGGATFHFTLPVAEEPP